MSVSNNSIPLNDLLESMHVSQDEFFAYYRDYIDSLEPTPEELEEKALADQEEQEYSEELLQSLHDIHAGVVSQNILLEENNRLLASSISSNSVPVSDNSVSQNSIMTTLLSEYSLTDSLLLFIAVGVFCCLFVFGFVKKGH